MKNTKILLTGGSGMLGQNILNNPLSKKFNIFAPSSKELNLFDYKKTYKYIANLKPHFIIHAAAKCGGIKYNIDEPLSFLSDNFDINRNLLKASKENKVKNLLNISSSCIYPLGNNKPITEDKILSGSFEPTNEGYALSKIYSLKFCEYLINFDKNFKYKSIIPCNLYGYFDNFSKNKSHLIPAAIEKIHFAKLNKKKTVTIWGDGKSKREFMFAYDLGDFILKKINRFDQLPKIMNIGIGRDYSVTDYYKKIAKIIGWNGIFKYDLSKPNGIKRKLVSIKKQNELNWKPKTLLEDGILKTYNFYLNNYKI